MKKWVKSMAPPVVSKDFYNTGDFQFSPVQYPKDEYVQEDSEYRVLSKFIPEVRIINLNEYYSEVYLFILRNIISNNNELVSCDMVHEDMEGNPNIIFNIRFKNNLSFSKRKQLHFDILKEINEFCISSDFSFIFANITVLLVKGRD